MNSDQNGATRAAEKTKDQEKQNPGPGPETGGSENEETTDTSQSQTQSIKSSATQFSVVQRTDTDGLRMRISAIRPLAPPPSLKTTCKMSTTTDSLSCFRQEEITTNKLNKTSKKIKVKRKKLSHTDAVNPSKVRKSGGVAAASMGGIFSSDSDDDLPLKVHQQRAPRLLLTAIAGHQASGQAPPPPDSIGISSSDNELPSLVQAAIKRVESDTEDTSVSLGATGKSKHLPQYQSTLLQDFMEKTQMLGQHQLVGGGDRVKPKEETQPPANPRKRRGRPKKLNPHISSNLRAGSVVTARPAAVNESADSGVISTTSTTQSTTPSPKMPNSSDPPQGQARGLDSAAGNSSTKIDMSYLDKRMYATERVLYPPPRNKRRQIKNPKNIKDAEQVDPLWREIDVNKKFRLRSMSVGASGGAGGSGRGGSGGVGSAICSKILVANSGYVSDYGSVRHPHSSHSRSNHNSGYKSDASCKSRYSVKSCVSRRSRAKSCGYRSDCKEGGKSSIRLRRRRRPSTMITTTADVEDQDILQLAGLSLGQSSEESNEYISKPSLQSLPSTSASKKYGEINRYITTGQYFSREPNPSQSQNQPEATFISKMLLNQRKDSSQGASNAQSSCRFPCKIKSRRSSAASMCSSYVSGVSRMLRRRHRRNKSLHIDSKLLTEIEILTSTFHGRCRIQDDRLTGSSGKEKLLAEATKLKATTLNAAAPASNLAQHSLIVNGGIAGGLTGGTTTTAATTTSSTSSTGKPLKRAMKKRKLSEPLVDFAMLSASANANSDGVGGASNVQSSGAGSSKRRHKKSQGSSTSSSPDDHKLPLKKRHYLLTPGERPPADSSNFANGKLNAEAWAAAAATAKTTASTKSQAQFNARSAKSLLTPKKRHLLEHQSGGVTTTSASNSPLRIVVDTNSSISGGKLLDISPSSLGSLKQQKRASVASSNKQKRDLATHLHSPAPSGSGSCPPPPPGIFEPSVELEIQIPLSKLNESVIITKSEVASPLLSLDIKEDTKKEMGQRVVESLLHKTGGNLLLKRKRKKINRTGFPTVRRKKRKVSLEQLQTEKSREQMDQEQEEQDPLSRETRSTNSNNPAQNCERVPLVGEARETFVARSNARMTPRLSVVALERLQRPQTPSRGRPRGRKPKDKLEQVAESSAVASSAPPPPSEKTVAKKRGRRQLAKPEGEQELAITIPTPAKNKLLVEPNIKLPAGVDPNTNFSCKIRLKRRRNLEEITSKEIVSQDELDKEAEAKRLDVIPNEHDPLPMQECTSSSTLAMHSQPDYASCSESSEDKLSTASRNKISKLKKNYLVAGLLSNYFKQATKPLPVKHQGGSKDSIAPSSGQRLMPPPPYCERYHRRTQIDFELPYDIWWAYTNAKLPQRHQVPSWNYRKIRTNVYAESVRPNLAGFDHPVCNCKESCMDNCLNRMVYTECSATNCPSGDKCHNQKIHRHEVAPGVERFMTADKGWGVRTKLPIAKGTYILEYVGEVVTEREFKQRMASIYLNDTHHYCLHLDGGLVIDGQRMGSDCRFVNHSCEPNCEMQKWSVNGLSRMVLFAKRHIKQGEELTYDYNFSLFNPSEGQPCRCGMPQCRGVIGGKSQRVKPLPPIAAVSVEASPQRGGRQRKHKAKKHPQKGGTAAGGSGSMPLVNKLVQQLSERERKLAKQFNVFLVRNYEKIRRYKVKRSHKASSAIGASAASTSQGSLSGRRPSTPSSSSLLAAQISALCTPRNIKTRGLAQAVQDPELEKMARMAVVLRDICQTLETMNMSEILSLSAAASKQSKRKNAKNANSAVSSSSSSSATTAGALPAGRLEFKGIQSMVEQGHYKSPQEFDAHMQQLFEEVGKTYTDDESKMNFLQSLVECYEQQKVSSYEQLVDILGDSVDLQGFKPKQVEPQPAAEPVIEETQITPLPPPVVTDDEDVISCICGLYKDEGLMIQCSKCMVWQHTECTKADINAENYQCERCEPRKVDREIPLDEFTEEGHRYYLSLMRGNDLQVRQGDAVYVLRDIPIKDNEEQKKHTYETIGKIDYQECDIFRVEHLWKNETGKRFIFGHHFLRPHETFHEPTRRFYPNEVVRVSLYEVVPIELVIGRCWVLDRTTFCKGRPIECQDESHCYICELRVDKSARFFSKTKASYPACTKSYAFRKFPERVKISKTYAPHDVDASMLKTKKQKTELEVATTAKQQRITVREGRRRQPRAPEPSNVATKSIGGVGTTNSTAVVQVLTPILPNGQLLKRKRSRLENVLITMKLKCLDAQTAQEQPIDLSYLLSGRGARQRKTNNNQTTTSDIGHN
ncbi:LOW QUALITY PROTEIN: histone-lysine N-methyltransferase ash1 [Drosophila tropicalis]|uniref:LOW QUALITY PROTEIN: histone-lysine N-methyltransferase ash1 n=1 Tax=Drosophila tropicalis TaxID=46794 RepID=UPI0035AB78C7